MSDRIPSVSDLPEQPQTSRWSGMMIVAALIPLLLLGGLMAVLVVTGAGLGERSAPPIEDLTFNRVTLPAPNEIVLTVTNGGADPVTIAQVIYEIGRLLLRQRTEDAPVFSWTTLGGLVTGMALMYLTALLVAA